jgi:predicted membrane protein
MNKKDWIEIIIKGFGIYFIVLAIIAIPGLISGFLAVPLYLYHAIPESGSEVPSYMKQLHLTLLTSSATSILRFIVYVFAAKYFLTGPKLIYRLIDKGNKITEPEDAQEN